MKIEPLEAVTVPIWFVWDDFENYEGPTFYIVKGPSVDEDWSAGFIASTSILKIFGGFGLKSS